MRVVVALAVVVLSLTLDRSGASRLVTTAWGERTGRVLGCGAWGVARGARGGVELALGRAATWREGGRHCPVGPSAAHRTAARLPRPSLCPQAQRRYLSRGGSPPRKMRARSRGCSRTLRGGGCAVHGREGWRLRRPVAHLRGHRRKEPGSRANGDEQGSAADSAKVDARATSVALNNGNVRDPGGSETYVPMLALPLGQAPPATRVAPPATRHSRRTKHHPQLASRHLPFASRHALPATRAAAHAMASSLSH